MSVCKEGVAVLPYSTWSVQTPKLSRVFGPNAVMIATSAASRDELAPNPRHVESTLCDTTWSSGSASGVSTLHRVGEQYGTVNLKAIRYNHIGSFLVTTAG